MFFRILGQLATLLAAICTCSSLTKASTLSLSFDVALFSEFTPGLPAPDRLTGFVAWTFDDLDPIHSTQVTSLNLTLNGRVFTLPEVGVFTSANTSIPSDMIVIGGIYDGTFPNTLGSYGPSTDFGLGIGNAFTAPFLLGAAAVFEQIPNGGFRTCIEFDRAGSACPYGVSAVPGPLVGAGLPGLFMAIAGFIGWCRSRRASRPGSH
jgi:hypothetical protein